ncbi:hypothetical protein Trydic_g22957 [Trypoxylus dichotomus]
MQSRNLNDIRDVRADGYKAKPHLLVVHPARELTRRCRKEQSLSWPTASGEGSNKREGCRIKHKDMYLECLESSRNWKSS